MILKHSYSLKLLRSKHLGPARLQHRAVQPEHSTSKAAGCLRNTQDCKKQSIPLYCNILRLQHWSLPLLRTQLCTPQLEAGVRTGRNRWCSQGAKTTGCFRPFHPTTNQFGEGGERGVSVILLSAWTDCPDHCPGSPVRSVSEAAASGDRMLGLPFRQNVRYSSSCTVRKTGQRENIPFASTVFS